MVLMEYLNGLNSYRECCGSVGLGASHQLVLAPFLLEDAKDLKKETEKLARFLEGTSSAESDCTDGKKQ